MDLLDSTNQPKNELPDDEERKSNEPLISISNLSEKIKIYPYYHHQEITGSLNDCYVREGVAEKLIDAAKKLESNHHFVILDGWRPYQTQLALYSLTKKDFLANYQITEEQVTELLKKYVAYPSRRRESPAPHYTGGAVDLTIANEKGWLNMGTAFDEFHEKARSDYFEKKEKLTCEERIIRDNRRMLRELMEQAGFLSNPEEWWHYDYGNPRWAAANNKSPLYLGIEL